MQRIARIVLIRAIRIATHRLERQRLDRAAVGRGQGRVLAVTGRSQDKAPLPTGRQRRQRTRVEAHGQVVAGTEEDEALVALAQQFRYVTEARQPPRLPYQRHVFFAIVVIQRRRSTVRRTFLDDAARGRRPVVQQVLARKGLVREKNTSIDARSL